MITTVDLHPDDTSARRQLRDQLWEARRTAGISLADLAHRMGVVKSAAANAESRTSWRMSTLRRWARALGYDLMAQPAGLPEAPPDVAVLHAMVTDDARGDRFAVAALVAELSAARIALGLTKADVARQLGVTDRGVRSVENGMFADIMVITPQRMCRALGGSLDLDLGVTS